VRELTFVLSPNRVSLSGQDVAKLNAWFWGESSIAGRQQLREPLTAAPKTGDDVVVRDNDGRAVLLAILDRMEEAAEITTDGLRELHRVARLPLAGGG
jgi:hypothetical protein